MKEITVLGIDLAKNSFQLHGINAYGKTVVKKKVTRSRLLDEVAKCAPSKMVAMEACGGSNYFAREFKKMGLEPKIIAAHFVKPYVKSQKNDAADAEAICEAAQRPNMRFVPIKEVPQQDIQSIHRVRQRIIKQRTATTNEIRSLLMEYGIVIPQGPHNVRKKLPRIIENQEQKLSITFIALLRELYQEVLELDDRVAGYDKKLDVIFKDNEMCQKMATIPGVGKITATAIFSAAGDPTAFKNGRNFSAWLGLVPRQVSTGGKQKLLGITKRGDKYIRSLLVQGANSFLLQADKRDDPLSKWAVELMNKKGRQKAAVAVANKMARTIWRVLAGKKIN